MKKRKKRELILSLTKKDFVIQAYKGSGPGGQHRNKTSTAIRIKHPESGAVGECQSHKSQFQNKKEAFRRMADSKKFRTWLNIECSRIMSGKSIEQKVEEQINEQFLKFEVKDDNDKWINVNLKHFGE